MLRGLAISHSGLRFAQERLRSTAHYTANATTAETASFRALGRERSEGGVETEVELGRPLKRVEEAVELIAASQHFCRRGPRRADAGRDAGRVAGHRELK